MKFKKKTISKAQKEKILNNIKDAGKIYKNELMDKTFLILYEGNDVEITFRADNFLHLCGVETSLLAKNFLKEAVDGTLKTNEIYFSKRHYSDLAIKKTENLTKALSLLKNESFLATYIITDTFVYKIGTTDLDVLLCFDYHRKNGSIINDILIPRSLRVENIDNEKFHEMYQIDYVLSKASYTGSYTKIEYGEYEKLEQYIKDYNITGYNIDIKPDDGGGGGNGNESHKQEEEKEDPKDPPATPPATAGFDGSENSQREETEGKGTAESQNGTSNMDIVDSLEDYGLDER